MTDAYIEIRQRTLGGTTIWTAWEVSDAGKTCLLDSMAFWAGTRRAPLQRRAHYAPVWT